MGNKRGAKTRKKKIFGRGKCKQSQARRNYHKEKAAAKLHVDIPHDLDITITPAETMVEINSEDIATAQEMQDKNNANINVNDLLIQESAYSDIEEVSLIPMPDDEDDSFFAREINHQHNVNYSSIIECSQSSEETIEDENWNEEDDESLPELVTEWASSASHKSIADTVTGRRVVNLPHFLKEFNDKLLHHKSKCTMSRLVLERESKREGLAFYLTYRCTACQTPIIISSEPRGKTDEINKELVWGATATGLGFSNCEELLAVMDIPMMQSKTYRKKEVDIEKVWRTHLYNKMKDAAAEEYRIAESKGDVVNGVAYITVVVDGGWCRRTYGHGYNANSGVAVIVGAATGKLLFLGVRNKFCLTCARAETRNTEAANHNCYKNYIGTSTGMEQDIIVEGFCVSEPDYKLQYRFLVGDGDSSVFKKVREKCPYGRSVSKIECPNHAVRNYTSNLYKIPKDLQLPADVKSLLNQRKARLTAAVRGAIKNAAEKKSSVSVLIADLRNAAFHVFGRHVNCRDEYCRRKDDPNEVDYIDRIKEVGLLQYLQHVVEFLVYKADRLIKNMTTNLAEGFMSKVSKVTGGKRRDLSKGGGYERAALAAGLMHSTGSSWHKSPLKRLLGRSPGEHTKKFCAGRAANLESTRKRRRLQQESGERPIRTKLRFAGPDSNYGKQEDGVGDLDDETLKDKMTARLKELQVIADSLEKRIEIERATILQSKSPLWHEYRSTYLTASHFGDIVNRRDYTPANGHVKMCLYPADLSNRECIKYGVVNEAKALESYETISSVHPEPCGLFIYDKVPYLAATPDGLIGDGGLVEVKCLPSIGTAKIKDCVPKPSTKNTRGTNSNLNETPVGSSSVKNNISKHINFLYWNGDNLQLKEKHHYSRQIQGQLNITGREFCDLILFSANDIEIIRIYKNVEMWENEMLPQLQRFYNECILPELCDSRIARQQNARNGPFITNAISLRERELEAKAQKKK